MDFINWWVLRHPLLHGLVVSAFELAYYFSSNKGVKLDCFWNCNCLSRAHRWLLVRICTLYLWKIQIALKLKMPYCLIFGPLIQFFLAWMHWMYYYFLSYPRFLRPPAIFKNLCCGFQAGFVVNWYCSSTSIILFHVKLLFLRTAWHSPIRTESELRHVVWHFDICCSLIK